mmetsp:Transcript_26634/g.58383  ORF Transcript_26634/g.58383 Transcript_26634/m.58383 type:complete len:264 (-) Transcript_26634:320-1111(-)
MGLQVRRDYFLLEPFLVTLAQISLRLEHDIAACSLAILHPLVHLLPRLDSVPPLVELVAPRLPLLLHQRRQLGQLRLGSLARMRRVRRHEQQFVKIALLGAQRALDRPELVVEVDPLVLEPLDDLVVGLADGLRLVELDHGLVEPVLERPDLAQLRIRRGVGRLGALLDVAKLVLLARQGNLFGAVRVGELVVALTKLRQLSLHLCYLGFAQPCILHARAVLLVDRRQRRAQLLVLAAHRIARFLVLLERELALLVESFAVSF